MLHTYAPKTVGIQSVDEKIVDNLHRVYSPEEYEQWPLRPQFDLISKDLNGDRLCDPGWCELLIKELASSGFEASEGSCYPLHPVTTAYHHAKRYPHQSLCLEVRRDLLVEAWQPFSEMEVSPKKASEIAAIIAKATVHHWLREA